MNNDRGQNDGPETFVRKRIINHRQKQIETRIQRKIVLEDGVMISDSGPLITTKTVEDTQQEFQEEDIEQNDDLGLKDNTTNVDEKGKKVLETYLFGFDGKVDAMKTDTSPNQPKKYYFGQQDQTEVKPNISDINVIGHVNTTTMSSEERDCQFTYEFDDSFARYH